MRALVIDQVAILPNREDIGFPVRKMSETFSVPGTPAVDLGRGLQCNSTESILLRLPAEIRIRIWRFVLGDNFIHMQQLYDYRFKPGQCLYRKRWLCWICISCLSIRERKLIVRLLDYEADPKHNSYKPIPSMYDGKEHYNHRVSRCPGPLVDRGTLIARALAANLGCIRQLCIPQLQCLRVCHQLYDEALPVFWSTNTFSFHLEEDLRDFENLLSNAGQKHQITKLHIGVRRQDPFIWRSAGPKRNLRSLRGIKQLHVDIEGHNKPDPSIYNKILSFQQLPLQKVTISINDKTSCEVRQDARFRQEELWAEELRQKLLDPEGALRWAEREEEVQRRKQETRSENLRALCCRNHSTIEECTQRRRTHLVNGDVRKAPKNLGPCGRSHVCLICNSVNSHGPLRFAQAIKCARPGRCTETVALAPQE